MSRRRKAVVLNEEWNRNATFLSLDHWIYRIWTPSASVSRPMAQAGLYFPSFSRMYRTTRAMFPSRSIFVEYVDPENSHEATWSHQSISTISRVLSMTGQVLLRGVVMNSRKSGIWRWSSARIDFYILRIVSDYLILGKLNSKKST